MKREGVGEGEARMRVEGLRLSNFRAFRDARLDLPSLGFVVGANGSGKSTLFDVFAFLQDALQHNVHVALARRGGFQEVRSRGERGPIALSLKLRAEGGPLVTYEVAIEERGGRAVVSRERLMYRRGRQGRPWHFLDFQEGRGTAITNEEEYGREGAQEERQEQQLQDPEVLALKGLGQFERFKATSALRRLIEGWHLSNLHIQELRPGQEVSWAEQLSTRGENLAAVARHLRQRHPERFEAVLEKMRQRVPGVRAVDSAETVDGRLVLRFQDGAFQDPFLARHVSDGTLKMFAYLVLLYDPRPHPLLGIEEPENQLYPTLLAELAEEFRAYAARGGQVLVSTHSPSLLNAAKPDEVIWLEKVGGFTRALRAKDDPQVKALCQAGDALGALWTEGLFGRANP